MLEDKGHILRFNRSDKGVLHRIYDKYKDDLVTLAAALPMEFKWFEGVAPALFEPSIPADYAPLVP